MANYKIEDVSRGARLLMKSGNFGSANLLVEPLTRLDSKAKRIVACSYIRAGNLQAGVLILKSLSDSGDKSAEKLLRRVLDLYKTNTHIVEFDPLGFFGIQKTGPWRGQTTIEQIKTDETRTGAPGALSRRGRAQQKTSTRQARATRLGDLVRSFRAELGITQRGLDMKIGKAPQYTSKLEQGRIIEPRRATLVKIIDVFEKHPEIALTPEFIELRKICYR